MVLEKSHTFILLAVLSLISSISHAADEHHADEVCEVCVVLSSHDDDVVTTPKTIHGIEEQPPLKHSQATATSKDCDSILDAYAIRGPPLSL